MSEPNDRDRAFAQGVINSLCLNGADDRDILEDRAAQYREQTEKKTLDRMLTEVERLRTVLDSEDSLLRQLSEWLRGTP